MATPCEACSGMGVCPHCQGRGVEEFAWRDAAPCGECGGLGICAFCGGSGVAPLVKPSDPSYT